MTVICGVVQNGVGDFKKRMNEYSEVFRKATGEDLIPGTINVKVPSEIKVKEDFRVKGGDIDDPEQDFIFEKCLINEIPAFRIRPWNLTNGTGGWGDDVIEISSSQLVPNVKDGDNVKITFFRDDIDSSPNV